MKIMLRATNWVGDAVMSLPALYALRKAREADEITVVARPWVADLYQTLNVANRVMIHNPKHGRGELAREIAAEKFDLAILFPNSFDAAWISRRAGVPERWGYARDARGWLLTRAIPPPKPGELPAHQSYYYLELLRRLGVIASLPSVEDFVLPGLSVRTAATRDAIVGLNPGAAFGGAKRWIPARYVELGRRLRRERGVQIKLFGSAAERALTEEMARAIGDGAVSTAGETTLGDFLKLAVGCDLFVTNDTGTMHVAAAAGVPVLAVFGSTDERATSPLGPRVTLLKRPVSCSPCLLRHCPVDHRCMREITVNEVFEASCKILDGRPFSSTATGR